MPRLAIIAAASLLITGGCSTLQTPAVQTPVAADTTIVKKKAAGELDLVEVRDQLSLFVEIIELLAQSENAGTAIENVATGIPIDIKADIATNSKSAPTDTQQLTDIVKSINNNLEKLDKAQNETQSIRQLLAIADQYSGNKLNLFSSMFEILAREKSPTQ